MFCSVWVESSVLWGNGLKEKVRGEICISFEDY